MAREICYIGFSMVGAMLHDRFRAMDIPLYDQPGEAIAKGEWLHLEAGQVLTTDLTAEAFRAFPMDSGL